MAEQRQHARMEVWICLIRGDLVPQNLGALACVEIGDKCAVETGEARR